MHKTTNLSSDEETFLDIITLGLVRKLSKFVFLKVMLLLIDLFWDVILFGNMEGIVALNVEKRPPCNRLIVAAWEQNNDVALPPDLREFYASTDGFEMSWKYQNCNQRENKESETITVEGEIKISALTHVKPLHFAHKQRIKHQSAANRLKVNQKTKSLNMCENAWNQNNNFKMAFVLSSHANVGTVCLVYHNDKEPSHPTASTHAAPPSSIWLLDTGNNWHFLAEDFSSYFRMMLIHVGLQNWQLKFTSQGLTTSCRRTASLVLPHLFHEDSTDEASKWEMTPNVINSNVFKSNQGNSKSSKSTPVKSKHGSHHKVKKN